MIRGWRAETTIAAVFEPKRTAHFNVMYKGSGMASRILAQEIEGSRPSDIEWILMVETGRKATLKEIRELCAGKWKGEFSGSA
jgi:hypothetical protein